MRPRLPILLALLAAGCATASQPMRLRRVVLYQNGVGYFERAGRADEGGVRLRLAAHEVDDVLTTLTVLDDAPGQTAPSATVPRERAGQGETQVVTLGLGGADREVTVAYSAPTSAWRASYRLVLPDERGGDESWLQAWAVVDNTSAEDWDDVELTLATAEPLSFAVDLRTPRFVDRPNLTGHATVPVAFGPVRSEQTTRGDRDGDGILDVDDRCPDELEDRDSFEDIDGCPDPDNDHDRIPDAEDAAPLDPETYNGVDDEDGAPDVGRVVVESTSVHVLERVYFAAGEPTIGERSGPLLDAIAQTMQGNPQIRRVEIRGHAADDEDSPWRLSAERAAMVRAALRDRGVASERLVARAFGATRPVSPGSSERNRRVDFEVAEVADAAEPSGAVRRERLAGSARLARLPRAGDGGTRFPVARGVSVPAGDSAMVTILHQAVQAEDVLLHRVHAAVPASAQHPFRAARLVNQSGVDLVEGPISLFAGGELVGEGLLSALRAGENAFVPYAVDGSTHVARETERELAPARILGAADGRLEVERTATVRTTYRVEAGARVPARLYVHHPRTPDHEPVALPPHAETSPSALLLPIPLAAREDSVFVIEERRAVRGEVDLVRELSVDLDPFLAGSDLPPPLVSRLRPVLDAREALVRVRERAAALNEQLAEAARRSAELRRSVVALDSRAGRSTSPIRRRMATRLEAAVADAERLADQLAAARATEIDAMAALREAAQDLSFGER